MNRQEHLQWCKNRSLEYLDNNDSVNAITSMLSDLSKHEETSNHAGIELGMQLQFGGFMNTENEIRKWIVGFN